MNETVLHERGLLQFLSKNSRSRVSKLLEKENHEEMVRRLLDHDIEIDIKSCNLLIGRESTPKGVIEKLYSLGASKVGYIFSSRKGVYGLRIDAREALETYVGRGFGFFLSFQPGELAYYEQEAPGFQCVLVSKQR